MKNCSSFWENIEKGVDLFIFPSWCCNLTKSTSTVANFVMIYNLVLNEYILLLTLIFRSILQLRTVKAYYYQWLCGEIFFSEEKKKKKEPH